MNKLVLVLLLCPSVVFAQLDRIRTDMNESEFRKAVPEATRNLEAESGWIEDTGSVGDISGSFRWRIYNDSIDFFHFTSGTVQGPSEQFPAVDSAEIHELKVKADRLRASIELTHGKPRTFYNECLSCASMMDNPFVYFAEWVLPDKGSIVIVVSIDQSHVFGSQINKAYTPVRRSETYYLFFQTSASSLFSKTKYDVGRSVNDFLHLHPEYEPQATFTHNHTYTIKDTATSDNAIWQFIFVDDVLAYMEYNAWLGSNYGDNDVEAFGAAKKRANQLLTQAKESEGRPKSIVNEVPKTYTVRMDYLAYRNEYIVAEWKSKYGLSSMEFEEFGGGKHGGTTFHIQYVYERGEQK